jgi:hypothetical protein
MSFGRALLLVFIFDFGGHVHGLLWHNCRYRSASPMIAFLIGDTLLASPELRIMGVMEPADCLKVLTRSAFESLSPNN